jgi:diacylglycerol kinase family enzyme/membrane-associated phospholipid phosphatase
VRVPIRKRIAAADQNLLSRMTSGRPGVDLAMHGLGRAADKGGLWIAVAIGLGARRDKWTRRAALRGLAGMAIASTTANLVAKQLSGRARPEDPRVFADRLSRTTSFPSGHAASAAAFATGVALEVPALAVPIGGLATLVAVSRLVTRVQYPSDVVAGAAVGAAAGLVTLRWWPRRSSEPAAAIRPRRNAPASPSGSGLVLVVNCSAGTASADLAESLGASLPEAEIILVTANDDLADLVRKAAVRARIPGIAVEAGLPLLVVPAGTFNHFAADLGVSGADDALAALRAGDSVLVDIGTADRETFLNTASTGVYVDLVKTRERLEPAIGKWPAMLIALVHVLWTGKPVELLADGRRRRVWLLFAGNCRYEPLGATPTYRPDLADGTFDVRMIDGSQPLARLRLVVAVLLGTLGRCRVYRTWSASSLRVASLDGDPVPLCLDGEAMETKPQISLVKRPRKLLVYRPAARPDRRSAIPPSRQRRNLAQLRSPVSARSAGSPAAPSSPPSASS